MTFWATLQLYTGKHYSPNLGNLMFIRWESRRGTLAAEHASCPGCVCEDSPKCRHEHRLKRDLRFTVTQPTPGTFRWTAPSGRSYDSEPARYPI